MRRSYPLKIALSSRVAAFGVLLCVVTVSAGERPPLAVGPAAHEVRSAVREQLERLPKNVQAAVVAWEIGADRPWVFENGDVPLKPASVMKLMTTAAALNRLGADFQFETRLYVHDDELWVVGAGDPGLGDERLARRRGKAKHYELHDWQARVRAAGQTRLRGIVIDDSVFTSDVRHPDWPDDQQAAWYQAPVGGLNFNTNCVDAHCRVSDSAVKIVLEPALPSVFTRNRIRLAGKHRPIATRRASEDVFEFRGTVTRSAALGPISVRRPALFVGYALQRALADSGIPVADRVVRRRLSAAERTRARLIATHRTPLREVLWRANAFSQNLHAEALFKSLAAYGSGGARTDRAGSWDTGRIALKRELSRLGVNTRGAIFRDGSGLSHGNRLTARQVVSLLRIMNEHPDRAAFLQSLARPGEDGTMRRRHFADRFDERLMGKTGTIKNVRALAGYLRRDDGRTLAFAILLNGRVNAQATRDIAQALLNSGVKAN